MKALVLGVGGQLGHELMRAAWPAGTEVVGLAHPDFDLTRPGDVDRVMAGHEPDALVNATAYTAVDKAESEAGVAYIVNRDGPAAMAAACAARNIPLIHVSTDYVFDGTRNGAYVEDDPVCPLNVYGASKAAGETAVRLGHSRHVILRTSWVYSAYGQNFVKTMRRLGAERDELRVVADQYGAPTAAADLAAAIVAIANRAVSAPESTPWGTYHYTGGGETTWCGFAERIFQHMAATTGRRPRLTPISAAEYPTPARRPTNSRLDCTRVRTAFGVATPAWEDSLDRVMRELDATAG